MKKIIITILILFTSYCYGIGEVEIEVQEKSGIFYSKINESIYFVVKPNVQTCYAGHEGNLLLISCDKLKNRVEWEKIITW